MSWVKVAFRVFPLTGSTGVVSGGGSCDVLGLFLGQSRLSSILPSRVAREWYLGVVQKTQRAEAELFMLPEHMGCNRRPRGLDAWV